MPSPDGVADILPGADDHGEDDEDAGGVQVIHSVVEVVVVTDFDVGDSPHRADDAVHPEDREKGGDG